MAIFGNGNTSYSQEEIDAFGPMGPNPPPRVGRPRYLEDNELPSNRRKTMLCPKCMQELTDSPEAVVIDGFKFHPMCVNITAPVAYQPLPVLPVAPPGINNDETSEDEEIMEKLCARFSDLDEDSIEEALDNSSVSTNDLLGANYVLFEKDSDVWVVTLYDIREDIAKDVSVTDAENSDTDPCDLDNSIQAYDLSGKIDIGVRLVLL